MKLRNTRATYQNTYTPSRARESDRKEKRILWFEELGKEDMPLVGGKNANIGEMLRAKISVPPGYAITAHAYHEFITKTGIAEKIYKRKKEC